MKYDNLRTKLPSSRVSHLLTVKFSIIQMCKLRRSTKLVPNPDKKFNIVIYGIDECPRGTNRSERLKSDLSKLVSVMSGINSNIHS